MNLYQPRVFAVMAWAVLVVLQVGVTMALAQPAPPEMLSRAQTAIDSGNLEEAESTLRQILSQDQDNGMARQALVDVLMRQMRWKDAAVEAGRLRSQFPKDARVWHLSALVAFRQGDFADAAQWAGQAIEQQRDLREAHRLRALSRFMIQDYEGYLSDLSTLIEMDPADPDPHYHLGRYYYEKQLFTESVEAFETALRVDPRHYRSHYFLGWCQQARGDLEAAKASYEKAIEIIDSSGISYGWPYSDLGDVLVIQGRREAGIKWLRRAVRNDPDLPYTHYKYASGLFKTETPGDIEKSLQAAVDLDPGYTEAYYLMGRYYQKIGERSKAQEAFATFKKLKADPVPSPSGVRR